MESTPSGEGRESRHSGSGRSRSGRSGSDRNRNRSGRSGSDRNRSHSGQSGREPRSGGSSRGPRSGERRRSGDGPDEFRPSDDVKRPRRSGGKPAPKLSGFQKFVKFITFGLVDPSKKKKAPAARREARPEKSERPERAERTRSAEDKPARERRAPKIVEPTTPRLYVGNLSYDATAADLETLFSDYGTVTEAAIVSHSDSQRSKGFAFVVMSSVEEAKAAAAALNDKEFQGRAMLVTGAKSEGRGEERAPREESGERSGRGERGERSGRGRERSERGERGGRRRSNDYEEDDKQSRRVKPLVIETISSPALLLEGLNADASEVDVTDLFAGIGTIMQRSEVGVSRDGLSRSLRIDLSGTEEAQKAVELLHGKSFMGRQISLTGASAGSDASAPAEAPAAEETPAAPEAPAAEETAPTA